MIHSIRFKHLIKEGLMVVIFNNNKGNSYNYNSNKTSIWTVLVTKVKATDQEGKYNLSIYRILMFLMFD